MAVTEPFDAHDVPSVSAGDLSSRLGTLNYLESWHRPYSGTLAPVFRSFLTDMAYTPPAAPSTNEQLKVVMQAEMDARGTRCVELERLVYLAISYVEVSTQPSPFSECDLEHLQCVFPHYNFEEKTAIALYHW